VIRFLVDLIAVFKVWFGHLIDQVSTMGSSSRRRELAQLQLELAKATQRLDEIERLSFRRRVAISPETVAIDEPSAFLFENAETRFAACVASGMSKIRSN
jgi:hypothetical protein